MDIIDKLAVLAEGAKYDVSCSSSGSRRRNAPGGIGNAKSCGICHSWADDGRCISLLKVLLSNACAYDCSYCVNRRTNDIKRTSFTPRELAELTIEFYRRNYIEGLFLSSAVVKNPDYTMELMIQAVSILRKEYRFNGYIHIKAIPGADANLIHRAGLLADRMSINIELPSQKSLKLLAPDKGRNDIIKPMNYIASGIVISKENKKKYKKSSHFVPAGQTTQLMVGATPESDYSIVRLSENLYDKFTLKRVYYSAYVPVNDLPLLPSLNTQPPLKREHRLYQADWLLRFYKFKAEEILEIPGTNLDIEVDPKAAWALRHMDIFPVEINKAEYEILLRVPGIGVTGAKRIVMARRYSNLTYENLKAMRVVLKRAQYFITANGKYYGNIPFGSSLLRENIKDPVVKSRQINGQVSLFDNNVN